MYSFEGSLNYLDEASNLGDLGQRTLTILMINSGLDTKWEFPLSKRLPWVNGSKWTLEEAASVVGVTRERMRQIQKSFEVYPLELPVSPKLLFDVLKVASESEDIEQFWSGLKAHHLVGFEDSWTQESLLELMTLVAKQSEIDALGRHFQRLRPPPRSNRMEQILRDNRMDLLGVVDLGKTEELTGLSAKDLIKVLKSMYPVVLGSHEFVLAIQKPPAMFIGTVAKQLLLNPEVSKEVLFEGLQRLMSYRGVKQLFRFEDFDLLLTDLFGSPVDLNNLDSSLWADVQFTNFEKAWIELFSETQRKSLHRDELTAVGNKLGMKPTSVGVYLSTSPIIRPSNSRRGYFRLI